MSCFAERSGIVAVQVSEANSAAPIAGAAEADEEDVHDLFGPLESDEETACLSPVQPSVMLVAACSSPAGWRARLVQQESRCSASYLRRRAAEFQQRWSSLRGEVKFCISISNDNCFQWRMGVGTPFFTGRHFLAVKCCGHQNSMLHESW